MLGRLKGDEKCPFCGEITAKFDEVDGVEDVMLGCSNPDCPGDIVDRLNYNTEKGMKNYDTKGYEESERVA